MKLLNKKLFLIHLVVILIFFQFGLTDSEYFKFRFSFNVDYTPGLWLSILDISTRVYITNSIIGNYLVLRDYISIRLSVKYKFLFLTRFIFLLFLTQLLLGLLFDFVITGQFYFYYNFTELFFSLYILCFVLVSDNNAFIKHSYLIHILLLLTFRFLVNF